MCWSSRGALLTTALFGLPRLTSTPVAARPGYYPNSSDEELLHKPAEQLRRQNMQQEPRSPDASSLASITTKVHSPSGSLHRIDVNVTRAVSMQDSIPEDATTKVTTEAVNRALPVESALHKYRAPCAAVVPVYQCKQLVDPPSRSCRIHRAARPSATLTASRRSSTSKRTASLKAASTRQWRSRRFLCSLSRPCHPRQAKPIEGGGYRHLHGTWCSRGSRTTAWSWGLGFRNEMG